MRSDDKETLRQYFLGLEDGHIYFFYRPRYTEVHEVADIDHLSIVLHPFDSKLYRLISLDSATLPPEAQNFNMIVGHIDKVDDKQSVILHELDQKRELVLGVPHIKQAASRPCGEGVYTILSINNQSHLIYSLELPRLDGKLNKSLRINTEGNLRIGVFNPLFEAQEDTLKNLPVIDESLKAKIGSSHIVYNEITTLLNIVHLKIALFKDFISLAKDLQRQLHPLKDTEKTADIFTDLKLQKERFPVSPLLEGNWK